jgi:hypothetical protein
VDGGVDVSERKKLLNAYISGLIRLGDKASDQMSMGGGAGDDSAEQRALVSVFQGVYRL